jgi:hypothetical protein
MMNAMLARTNTEGFEVGFYGEEAERAKAINEGTERMAERRFFEANEQDITDVKEAIATRMEARLQRSTSLGNLIAAVED